MNNRRHRQIVAYWFSPSESLNELRAGLQGIEARRELYGLPEVKIYYTDRCCQDNSLLGAVMPSLVEAAVRDARATTYNGEYYSSTLLTESHRVSFF